MTDPHEQDMKLAREIIACFWENEPGHYSEKPDPEEYRIGDWDRGHEVHCVLAGIEAGRKAERARAVGWLNGLAGPLITPPIEFLDEAAKLAGWADYRDVSVSVPSHKSVTAHASTLQRLAALEAENAWRPIEEAPKDGTKFDAWVPDAFGGHRVPDLSFNSRGKLRQHGLLTEADLPRWPTHFRPLPTPPAQGDEG